MVAPRGRAADRITGSGTVATRTRHIRAPGGTDRASGRATSRPKGVATLASMGQGPLSPSYSSGHDFAIEVEGVRFCFNADDFAARTGSAAARLGLVAREHLTPGLLADLVALTAHGRIIRPRTGFADHVAGHPSLAAGGPGGAVHWLRRMVFRGAWIDQQVRDGVLSPEWDDAVGFRFRSVATGDWAAEEPRPPDWRSLAYAGGSA